MDQTEQFYKDISEVSRTSLNNYSVIANDLRDKGLLDEQGLNNALIRVAENEAIEQITYFRRDYSENPNAALEEVRFVEGIYFLLKNNLFQKGKNKRHARSLLSKLSQSGHSFMLNSPEVDKTLDRLKKSLFLVMTPCSRECSYECH